MAKRRRESVLEVLVELVITIIATLLKLIFRIIMFVYDVITIYTSKYNIKSGNGFFRTYFNNGNYGEFKLYRKIIRIFDKDNVYTNIYLENENTDYTEIDVVALSEYGIYVFEMKNYSGYIYGSEKDKNWTQVLNKFSKYKFYNPIKQNYAHTKAIQKYLEICENDIIPVIVFSNHSKISKINVSEKIQIVQMGDVNNFIINNIKNKKVSFTISEIKDYSMKLIEKSNMPQQLKDKHVEQVKNIIDNSNSINNNV